MMGSFVPLGGFFSTPSDASIPLSGSCQHPSRCLQCDKNCEDEVIAASKGVFTPPVSEQYQSSLPSWMQMTELGNFDAFDAKVSVCFQIQFHTCLWLCFSCSTICLFQIEAMHLSIYLVIKDFDNNLTVVRTDM